ncbi:CBN-APH-1 protein [Caenorhabditis brenneri]|uniref:CBN-APH-1 protein n=1 Tax=Caenorhabditis brenneri TaxID=135651 RepID=G0PB93_CAEBE|nr:CBN-APH-1 protein [Caenorhabditis brenneri]
MGYLLTIACYIASFSPAVALFYSFIAHDPVRIILFFLGSFFWLVSILFSSLAWMGLSSILPDTFLMSLALCIFAQEFSRVAYFMLLKKAQKGLNKITRQGQISVAPGVSDLHNARHMLALVCGLGMGVISALFYTMNAFAIFSGPGTIGLPLALETGEIDPNRAGKFLPLCYVLSAILLTLFHVTWTIMVWDMCHKIDRLPSAFVPGAAALVSHLLVAFLSSLNARGFYIIVFSVQFLVLLICIAYCNVIMGGTIQTFINGIGQSLVDAVTLKQIRTWIDERKLRTQRVPDEPMTERGGSGSGGLEGGDSGGGAGGEANPSTSNTVDA